MIWNNSEKIFSVPEMTTSQHEDPPKDDLKIIDMEENIQKIASAVRPWDVGKQGAGSGKCVSERL